MEKQNDETKTSDTVAKVLTIGAGILSAAVLAYCGYKIIDNQLRKTEYEPDPNKITNV
ncbi:MAG: hypothetical protein ACTTKL_07855 [Treponema sp.]